MRINSTNDASILCEFREIRPSNSRVDRAYCEHQVQHSQKNGAFSQISPDILDRFSQSSYHMKALYVQMMDLYLNFQFFMGRCHGNQIMLWKCYQRRLIPLAFVALVLENELQYHVLAVCINSGDNGVTSSNNVVNFCLVTPEMTGLICVSLVRHYQKLAYVVEYLLIYWTNFRNLFTMWKHFTCKWWICTLFSNFSRDIAMATK